MRIDRIGNETYVLGDVNGDGRADLAIELNGRINLRAVDFDL